ncbi:hypothetical protein [Mycobacterium sp. URHB0044]|uniref:hypothetical protein n=1 Tax=Mycobacterium sp. URHB0044 TaxID=1380386 RepID=UPI000490D66F|nr:hypothetical protein [Mycobacterium sp. URHB0044]
MGAHDTSHRFDYLFEPVDGETTTAAVPAEGSVVAPESEKAARRWWPLPVVAISAVLVGAVVLFLRWSGPADVVPDPSQSVPTPVPTPIVTNAPVVESALEPAPAPPPPPEAVPSQATTKVRTAPVLIPPPAPSQAPSAAPAPTRAETSPAPSVRPPISVSPEPRPAFPNQHPPEGDPSRGGLLGGLF